MYLYIFHVVNTKGMYFFRYRDVIGEHFSGYLKWNRSRLHVNTRLNTT